jgi:hypothetical protein
MSGASRRLKAHKARGGGSSVHPFSAASSRDPLSSAAYSSPAKASGGKIAGQKPRRRIRAPALASGSGT